MRRISLLLFSLTLLLVGCTDVEGYEADISSLEEEVGELTTSLDSAEKENKELTNSLNNAEKENEELQVEIKNKTAEGDKIKKDYDNYKKRMEPYEDLEKAEAEARQIEAEAVKKAEAEAEEKRKKEEAAAKKAEQEAAEKARQEELAKGYETGITFDQLARNPDDYEGEKIKFSGRVVQVIEGDVETQLRFAVDDDYDKVIYLGYDPEIVDQRILDDDYLTIYGTSLGTISYQSTLGATITIPAAYVDKIEFN